MESLFEVIYKDDDGQDADGWLRIVLTDEGVVYDLYDNEGLQGEPIRSGYDFAQEIVERLV